MYLFNNIRDGRETASERFLVFNASFEYIGKRLNDIIIIIMENTASAAPGGYCTYIIIILSIPWYLTTQGPGGGGVKRFFSFRPILLFILIFN